MKLKDVEDEDIDAVSGVISNILKTVCGLARLIDNIRNSKENNEPCEKKVV